jgi:GR25 family glycosyltransferase involved in LPS biosynthesis
MIELNKRYVVLVTFIILTIVICIAYNIQSYTASQYDIYLINLKRRPDRYKQFMKYYTASELQNDPLIKFNAIDGSLLDVNNIPLTDLARNELKQLDNSGFRTKHYQLTKGAIGCYLSHVKLWEHILKTNTEYALVFEDDAKIPKRIKKIIDKQLKYIPSDWDIILFGHMCTECIAYKNYYSVNRFMLTHCYLIKRTAIIKIMETNTLFPISQQIDSHLSELTSILNIYATNDAANKVKQFSSRTDIQAPLYDKNSKHVNDRVKIVL